MDIIESAKITSGEQLVSALGTKAYWDERYKLELQNFTDHYDEGEIWFGRSAENRLIKYLSEAGLPLHTRFIDLGCGNGSLLRRLRQRGFTCLTGVDYCEDAIALAKSIAAEEEKKASNSLPKIDFKAVDLLEDNVNFGSFEVILDKGTWDAMSLSEDSEKRLSLYLSLVDRIIMKGGTFIIFSCNYTRSELCQQFSIPSLRFKREIASDNSFTFGGKEGVTSAGVVFEKIT